jgi:hypothetical protein
LFWSSNGGEGWFLPRLAMPAAPTIRTVPINKTGPLRLAQSFNTMVSPSRFCSAKRKHGAFARAVYAHPNAALMGVEASLLKDKDGKAFALEILQVAQPGAFAEVTYSWPRLLSNDPMRKTSYVTRIDDHVCGVGYYN